MRRNATAVVEFNVTHSRYIDAAPVGCKYSNEPYDIVIEQYYG